MDQAGGVKPLININKTHRIIFQELSKWVENKHTVFVTSVCAHTFFSMYDSKLISKKERVCQRIMITIKTVIFLSCMDLKGSELENGSCGIKVKFRYSTMGEG